MYTGPNIPKDGLVYLTDAGNPRSYPGTGTTWYDLSPSKIDSTLYSSPVFTDGVFTFDGVADYSNNGATPDSLEGDPNFTVCGFFKRLGNVNRDGCWGIGGGTINEGFENWCFDNDNEITMDLWGKQTYTTGVEFPLNEWIFAAWQKISGDMSIDKCIIWVDDVSYNGSELTVLRNNSPITVNVNDNGITIGAINNSTTYCSNFDISLFSVYDRVLSNDEVIQYYDSHKTRFD
jgi:hypothetical protein